MKKVLIVEDEKNIIDLLKYNLEKNGYLVDYALDGSKGRDLFFKKDYDLILLDLMIPEIDGISLCRDIRSKNREIPIIMLTARSSEADKIKGLDIGADDYITKPFSVMELMARINAIFRRVDRRPRSMVKEIGNLTIDFDKYSVYKNNQEINLTLKEFELLKLLVENNGDAVDRDIILEKVWGYNFIGETRTVDVHVRNLRLKLEEDDSNPRYIKTVRGVGYKIGMV